MTQKSSSTRFLPAILAISVIARLGSALAQGNTVEVLPGIWDQISYNSLAGRVLEGHGFTFAYNWWPATPAGAPTAHWSYLYVLYLTAVYFVLGPSPLAARIIQAVIAGILQPLLACRITGRLLGDKPAAAAALLVSVYGYFIYYAGALVTETFYIVAVLWMADTATALGAAGASRRAQKRRWIRLGVASGTAILLRQVVVFLVPIVLIWTWWRVFDSEKKRPDFSLRKLLAWGAAPVLIIAGFILPWTIRNYQAFDRFVLLNTNAGFAFFWGNHPLHKTSFIPIIGAGPRYGELIPAELRGLNEADLDRRLLQHGLRFVREDPARFMWLSLSRGKEFFKFWPTSRSRTLSNLVRVFSFGIYLPLFVTGMVAAALRFRSGIQQDNQGLLLMLFLASLYTGIHLLSWTLVRYRLPVDAVLMPFGALGLVFLMDGVRRLASKPARRRNRNQSPLQNLARS
ncbi:MAG: glycosyltransferase family 39 protein [Acidobacteriota bacterium]